MKITDEYGTWEVTEGEGCINKCLITPSEKYLVENPLVAPEPTTEEVLADLIQILADKGVIF